MNPSDYIILEFHHANLERPIYVRAGMIVGFQFDKSQQANVILSAGGIIYPVKESLDEIKAKIEALTQIQTMRGIAEGEQNNVPTVHNPPASEPLRKRKAGKARQRQ